MSFLTRAAKHVYARLPVRLVRRNSLNALLEDTARLTAVAARQNQEIEQAAERIDALTTDRDDLRHQVEAKLAEIETLTAAYSGEISRKQNQIVGAETSIKNLETHVSDLTRDIDRVTEALQTAEAQRDDLSVQLTQAQERLVVVEAGSLERDKTIVQLRTELETLGDHVGKLETERDFLSDHVGKLETERDFLSDHVGKLETERDFLSDHVGKLETELGQVKESEAGLIAEKSVFLNQLDVARGAIVHLGKGLSAREEKHSAPETPPIVTEIFPLPHGKKFGVDSDEDLAAIKQKKREWVHEHLSCPACLEAKIKAEGDDLFCQSCEERFSVTPNGTLNFISPKLGIDHAIEHTDNVSAHGYDEAALTLIKSVAEGGGMVLDCGAGSKNINSPNVLNVEIVDYPSTDVMAVGQSLPFQDGSFDAVVSIAVLEHVTDPFVCAKELYRVTKPGGKLLISVPFLQPEHGYPHHYFNMTREGLRRLFNEMGTVENHWVPLSQHPLFSLVWFLAVYRVNLPPQTAEIFANMKIGDIVDSDTYDLAISDVGEHLGRDGRWQLASGHSMILTKDG